MISKKLSAKNIYKKVFVAFCSILLLTTLLSVPIELKASDGNSTVNAGQLFQWGDWTQNTFERQGQQGFYAMYSGKTNMDNCFDTNSLLPCERDSELSSPFWKIPNDDGSFAEDFLIGCGVNYEGNPTPYQSAINLKTGYSAVLRWIAPVSGSFTVSAAWRCNDHTGIFTKDNDGVQVGVYLNGKNIFYHDQSESIADWNNQLCPKYKSNGTIELKSGDSLYFVCDPKDSGTGDCTWLNVTVKYFGVLKKEKQLPKADTSANPSVGELYRWGDWTQNTFEKQGQQGFYAMYSTSTDMGKEFPIKNTYLCERDTDADSPFWKIPYADGKFVSDFLIGTGVDYSGKPTLYQSAFRLVDGYSAVLRWVVPADGKYTVDAVWKTDDHTGVFTGNNDGLQVGIYIDSTNIFYVDRTEKLIGWGVNLEPSYSNTIDLFKGESLYFTGDPKEIAGDDAPWLNVEIEYVDILYHDYAEEWSYNTDEHYRACILERHPDIKDKGKHRFGEQKIIAEPTYNTPQVISHKCTVCGYVEEKATFVAEVGDVNGDKSIDVLDLVNIKKLLVNGQAENNSKADVNFDGDYNSGDVVRMKKILLGIDSDTKELGKEYIFGDDAFNQFRNQGDDGFYAMYSDDVNNGTDFPISSLKKMEYWQLQNRQWMPNDGENTWTYVRSNGQIVLCGHSVAIKWVAPEGRTYYIDFYVYGGEKAEGASSGNGIDCSLYRGTQQLAFMSQDTTHMLTKSEAEKNSERHITQILTLNKGEELYFIADPKEWVDGVGDIPSFHISIKTDNQNIDYKYGMMPYSGNFPDDVSAYTAPDEFPQYDVKYIVKANGKYVGVYSEKNSWEKSVNFALFEMREGKTVSVEVTPLFNYVNYKILPDKYGIKSTRSGNSIRFELSDSKAKLSFVFDDNYKNTTLHLFTNPIDNSAPTESNDNIIYFGPGYHKLTEDIAPKSGQTVYLANGAVVDGAIVVEYAQNVKIAGSGIIMKDENSLTGWRVIRIVNSADVNVSGVIAHVNRIAEWTTEVNNSGYVTFDNYKVVSPQWASTDAMDIVNSNNVKVLDSFLRATDDTVTIKAGYDKAQTKLNTISQIEVNNCILWNECNSAMVVGEESYAKYRNIKFTDIDVIFSYDDIWYHESLYERAAISVINTYGGPMENITWDNIRVNECERLICFAFVDEFYTQPVEPKEACQILNGTIKNITVKNVSSKSASKGIYANQIYLKGWSDEKPIDGIILENIIINGKKLTVDSDLIVKNEFVKNITVK